MWFKLIDTGKGLGALLAVAFALYGYYDLDLMGPVTKGGMMGMTGHSIYTGKKGEALYKQQIQQYRGSAADAGRGYYGDSE